MLKSDVKLFACILLLISSITVPDATVASNSDQNRFTYGVYIDKDNYCTATHCRITSPVTEASITMGLQVEARLLPYAYISHRQPERRILHISQALWNTTKSPEERYFIILHELAHEVLGHSHTLDGAEMVNSELEADLLAAQTLCKRGLRPESAGVLLKRVSNILREQSMLEFFPSLNYRVVQAGQWSQKTGACLL